MLRSLAEALHHSGQRAAARTELRVALRLATETSNTYQQAHVHSDLANSYQSADEHERARFHRQRALDLYGLLDAPEVDQTRSRQDELAPPCPS